MQFAGILTMKKNKSLIHICDESLTLAHHCGWSPPGPRCHHGLLPLEPSECPLWPVTGWMLIAHPNLVPGWFGTTTKQDRDMVQTERRSFFSLCHVSSASWCHTRARHLYLKKGVSEERRRPWLLSAVGMWVGLW